jgi:hypothetical protein
VKNWNVVITVYQDGFRRAVRALKSLGDVERSPYHNVLVMAVNNPLALLEALERQTQEIPALYDAISRVAPAMQSFEFNSVEQFRETAQSIVMRWLPRLAGRSSHVRLHRRGFKHNLPTPEAERFLDDALLDALKVAGTPGSISFSNPDAVIVIDTVDERAGVAFWDRHDLARYRLLRPD